MKPAGGVDTMHVFVGTDDSQQVALRVLEHSIRKHASGPVVVHPMTAEGIPLPKDARNRPRTGFSFCRFTIPERMGFRGRGLYLDADMLVLSDLAELWRIPFGEQKVLCTSQSEPPPAWRDNPFFHRGRQFSVMLLDCERLPWRIDEIVRGLDDGTYTYPQLMFEMCLVAPHEIEDRIPPEWNHLERLEPSTRLIHYTVVPTQPWKHRGNPHGAIWDRHLIEALEAGAVTARDLELGVAKGHLHPELLELRRHAPARPAPAPEPCDVELLFFVQFVTDLELLLPLVQQARRRAAPKIRARVAVDARAIEAMPQLAVALLDAGIELETVTLEQLRARSAPDLTNVAAVVTATESSARPHEAARRLVRAVHRRGGVAITLQHGFENIGLTWFDHVHGPGDTRFASDRILTWGPDELLHPWVLRETRVKCAPVGCTKAVVARARDRGAPDRTPLVAVFENLHWHRFDDDFRRRFLADLEAAAAACAARFVVRPHPAGKWLTVRHQGERPRAPNVEIADPRAEGANAWSSAKLLASADAVVTTPSTVALDAARAGIPIAIVAGDLDVARYAPLPALRSAQDWIEFVRGATSGEGRAAPAQAADAFAARVALPGDAVQRALDVVLGELRLSRAARLARRVELAAARIGDALSGARRRAIAPPRAPAAPAFDRASPTLVVVSYWNARPATELIELLDALRERPAGAPFALRVVVNRDREAALELPERLASIEVVTRNNVGFNLGAWEHGWRAAPAFGSYLFLQDDCRVERDEWLVPFREQLADPSVGLVGERSNPAWDRPWPEIERRFRGHRLREHFVDGVPADRMDAYHHYFRRHQVPLGERGDHLQTLVLAARRDVLERVGGFPPARNYGEAIAAEIALSKRVQAAGLRLVLAGERPFRSFSHPQWAGRATAAVV